MESTDEYIISLKWSGNELKSNCKILNSSFSRLVRVRSKYSFSIICELGKKEYYYQTTGIIFKHKQRFEKYDKFSYKQYLPVLNEFCRTWNCNYELFEEEDPNGKWSDGSPRYYKVYAKMLVCGAISVIENEELRIKNKHLNDRERIVNKINPSTLDKFDQSLVKDVAERLFNHLNSYKAVDFSALVTEKYFEDAYYEYDGDFRYRITKELDYKDVDAFFVSVMTQFSSIVAKSDNIASFEWYPQDNKKEYYGLKYNIFEIKIVRT